MKLLLMSSSRTADTGFLEAHAAEIATTLQGAKKAVFIPYAVVGEARVGGASLVERRFAEIGVVIESIDRAPDPRRAVAAADAVVVSGGNTFCLLKALYDHGLVETLRARVGEGVPYVGWSAGSNVAGKTMRTTNDMPIVHPPSFDALGVVPFQINPHYTDQVPPGWRGETRDERIREFLTVNPDERVVALPEGTALMMDDDAGVRLMGGDAWLFRAAAARERLRPGDELAHRLWI